MTSTPPPAAIHTPPTPLHGPRYDSPPHLSLRKSSRLNSKQSPSERTPSPTVDRSFDSATGELKRTPRARRSRSQLSPPSSPIDQDDMVAMTRSASKKALKQHDIAPTNPSKPAMMPLGLPTPSKTPRKKPLSTTMGPGGRVLFPGQTREHVDEQLATPSKRNKRVKKHVGFSLDEEMGENGSGNGKIEIYTDSKDRIPEVDPNEDNPFFVVEGGTRQVPKKRKREPDTEKQLQKGIEQLEDDRGMVYVFRGRKVYKRFDGPNPATRGGRDGTQSPLHAYSTNQEEMEDAQEVDSPSRKHFTRSSIKPRRLFNSDPEESRHHAGTTTDEEAVTDIEDPERHGLPATSRSAKVKSTLSKPAPLTTVTRSFEAPASPFDSWPRRKSTRDSSGSKREGESLQSGSKRAREATN